MQVKRVYSTDIYEKIMNASSEKKEDIYRYELMMPFEKKWACYNVPIRAKAAGGYDVVMASEMLGIMPPKLIDQSWKDAITCLKDESLWTACQQSIERSLHTFQDKGVELFVDDYLYTILLANPDSIYTKLSDGYAGDGGIPGYIFATILPNEFTMRRLPAALAHECNHNVRFQHIRWSNDISLAEMMIVEGLAENFAVSIYGEENLGPWVSKVDPEELEDYIKPIIKEGLTAQGMDNITAYLYGDDIARQRGYFPVGLPFCAGYACGYAMVKYYLEKTGEDIALATIRPACEILSAIEDFWGE
jgi:uncharacterized protein YjaZ